MSFGGRGRGFGTAGGAGRGSFGLGSTNTNSNGGFSGFGASSVPASADDDVWDDSPATVTKGGSTGGFGSTNGFGDESQSKGGFGGAGDGFGSSSGGFGSSNGFESSSAFGSDTFGSSNGFGSTGGGRGKGGGGRNCYKCGEEGHMSRECPKGGGGGGGGNRNCYKCGEEGHMSRECPQGGGGGGGGNRNCYKCGEEGHMSRECPQGGGGGGGGNRNCYKCGEEGHMSRECPKGGGGGGGSRSCYKCHQEGHISKDCPGTGDSSGGFGSSSGGGFGSSSGGGFGSSSGGGFGSSSGGGFGSSSGGGFGSSSGGGFGEASTDGGFGGSNGGFGGSSGGGGGFGGSSGGFGESSGDGFGSSGGFGGGSGGGGGGGSGCRNCGQDGHFARECPEPKKGGDGCRNCGESGHFARECPNPKKPQGACRTCNQEGHFAKDCPQNEGKPPVEHYVPPEIDDNEEAMFKSVQVGINFDKYDEIPVELTGNNPTNPIQSFSEAGLLETVESNVKKAKYFKPTPIQKYAIPAIAAGRDLMGCAQTGSGKTAAFLLPVLTGMIQRGIDSSAYSPVQEPQALVIAPTRELVIQIYNECKKFSHGTIVRCVRLYGGTSTMHQLNDLSKGANIIIATPGRLLDFIGKQKIALGKIQYFILDEADRMLDMGFEPDMRRLVETMGMPEKTARQTLMFSATFPTEIQKLAGEFLNDYLFLTVGVVGGANQDVTQSVVEVPNLEKREKLLEILREHPGQRTLVFVELKRNADFLASMLSQSEFTTTSIHGDRLQREREQALLDFKSGTAPVLVATSVAARGLDIPGVDHVVNYDLPKEIDEYVHRIGRTGRCGNLGRATSFYDPVNNADMARHLVRCLAAAHQEVPEFLERAADGGGSSGGGRFGGRGQSGGGDMGAWDERPGGMAPAAMAADDDESWD